MPAADRKAGQAYPDPDPAALTAVKWLCDFENQPTIAKTLHDVSGGVMLGTARREASANDHASRLYRALRLDCMELKKSGT